MLFSLLYLEDFFTRGINANYNQYLILPYTDIDKSRFHDIHGQHIIEFTFHNSYAIMWHVPFTVIF